VLREVRRAHKTGQPILIGTTSVETSELIAEALSELGIVAKVSSCVVHGVVGW
jgi:preprotein translocase subunit SecA